MLRKLSRFIFALLAGISFVLAATVGVMWCLSNWYSGELRYTDTSIFDGGLRHKTARFYFAAHGIHSSWIAFDTRSASEYYVGYPATRTWIDRWQWSVVSVWSRSHGWPGVLGFFWVDFPKRTPDAHQIDVGAPWWGAFLILSILPSIFIVQVVLRRRVMLRRREGQCLACGYDLRATPDRCPECGATPNSISTTPA